MFFMLFTMINSISMARVTQQLMHKDGDELVTNGESAVNNSWEKEPCIKSLNNVKLVDNFMNMCDNILIMFKEYQKHFKERSIQPSPVIKKTLHKCENSTILNNRLIQNKPPKRKVIIVCEQDELSHKQVLTELESHSNFSSFLDKSKMAKQENVLKSVNLYNNTCSNLMLISCYVNGLFCFMDFLLNMEENPERWSNEMMTNANQFHAYFHELVFRLHKAFSHNKLCPFDEDSLEKLDHTLKQFKHEYEAEKEYWLMCKVSFCESNLAITKNSSIVQANNLTNLPNNPNKHDEQGESNCLFNPMTIMKQKQNKKKGMRLNDSFRL